MNSSIPRGVTLMELMLVITIIGIMVAIAIPVHGAYTLKARRNDAMTALVDIAARQADVHYTKNSYRADFNVLGYAGGLLADVAWRLGKGDDSAESPLKKVL